MANSQVGYQPRTTPAERRAFYDLERKLGDIELTPGPEGPPGPAGPVGPVGPPGPVIDQNANLLAGTNFTVPSSGFTARATRVGSLVAIEATVTYSNATASGANPQAAIIPAGYRPTGTVRAAGIWVGTSVLWQATAAGSLIVIIASVTNGQAGSVNLSYLAA